jgi:hypothetical protein
MDDASASPSKSPVKRQSSSSADSPPSAEENMRDGAVEVYQVGRRGELLPAPYSFAVSAFGPSAYSSDVWRESLQFIGRLIGISIRSSTPLALRLSPIFWKVVLFGGEAVTEADVSKIDIVTWHAVSTMSKFTDSRDFERVGYTFSILPLFSRVRNEQTGGSDDTVLTPLIPNGSTIAVTHSNFQQYRSRLLHFQRAELEGAIAEVRNGIAQIVPLAALRPFSPDKLARLVLGVPRIDIDVLRETTEYTGCSADTPAVQFLWRVLSDLEPSQQVTFLRFVSGRSRLPPRSLMARSNQHLRIKLIPLDVAGAADGDTGKVLRLPVSHTCMFQLDLPQYRSYEETRERLVFSLLNCIDFGLA